MKRSAPVELKGSSKRQCLRSEDCPCQTRSQRKTKSRVLKTVKHWFTLEDWWLCFRGLLPPELIELLISHIQAEETKECKTLNCGILVPKGYYTHDRFIINQFERCMLSILYLGIVSGDYPALEVLRHKYEQQSFEFKSYTNTFHCVDKGILLSIYIGLEYCFDCERLMHWNFLRCNTNKSEGGDCTALELF